MNITRATPGETVRRFNLGKDIAAVSDLLGVERDSVFQCAGLAEQQARILTSGVTASEYFKLADALSKVSGRDDFPVMLAEALASAPFIPASFVLACSATVEEGLRRFAELKKEIYPIIVSVESDRNRMGIEIISSDPDYEVPAALFCTEILFINRILQLCTGVDIYPAVVKVPVAPDRWPEWEMSCGCTVVYGGSQIQLFYSRTDADLPLLTENAVVLPGLEAALRDSYSVDNKPGLIATMDSIVTRQLAAGSCTLKSVASEMAVSTRTLQRRLQEDGVTFRIILDNKRRSLSSAYLLNSDLSIAEISCLVGFRQSGSFFKACQLWFSATPMEYRLGNRKETPPEL